MQADHAVPGGQGGSPPVGLSAPNMPYAEGGVRSMSEGMIGPDRSREWDSEEESPPHEGIDRFVDTQVNCQKMSKGWMALLGGTGGRTLEEEGFRSVHAFVVPSGV